MKVVILAGGLGTRLSEYTHMIPKPMVKINNKPILYYIMKHFSNYGHKDFYIALGYKGKIIKDYFKKQSFNWNINLIDTGLGTMTGGRLKKLKKYLKDEENFFLTYGDGVANVNLKNLLNFHNKKKDALVTMTAVRPPARFGAIKVIGQKVKLFREKSKIDEGWINGGFFVMKPKFIDYIEKSSTFLEKHPLQKVAKLNQLYAYKHNGFWQCMDTKRDKDYLENLFKKGKVKF
jgi:glucose-1-phosphate cytidylyltransferase